MFESDKKVLFCDECKAELHLNVREYVGGGVSEKKIQWKIKHKTIKCGDKNIMV